MENKLKKILLELRIQWLTELEKEEPNTKFLIFMSDSIDYQDAINLYAKIRYFAKVDTIKLIIDSPGGDPDAAYKIVRLLRQYCNTLVGVVPFSAKSAATLITLGTDKIEMGPVSELGPIDPQIRFPKSGYGPAQSVRDTIEYLLEKAEEANKKYSGETIGTVLYPIIDKMDPILLGQLERSVKAAKQYADSLLCDGMLNNNKEIVPSIVKKLSEGYYSHGYVIDQTEAEQMGLQIECITGTYWDRIWDLYYSYHFERRMSDEGKKAAFHIDTLESLKKELEDLKKNGSPNSCEDSNQSPEKADEDGTEEVDENSTKE